MEWISVNDKLPEEGVECILLCRFDCADYLEAYGLICIYNQDTQKWVDCFGGDEAVDEDYEVVYWTPVPDPPKDA